MMSPLRLQWLTWEMGPGIVPGVGSWFLNGIFCLTIPALLDHFVTVLRKGSMSTRVCELILLYDNTKRLSITWKFALVRSTQQSVRVAEAIQCRINKSVGAAPKEVVEKLLDTYFGFAWIAGPRLDLREDLSPLERLRVFFPRELFVCLQLLAAQLGCRSMLQRWLPLVWHCMNR